MKRCHRILQGILGCVVRPSTGSPPELGAAASGKGVCTFSCGPALFPSLAVGRPLRCRTYLTFMRALEGNRMVETEVSKACYILGQHSNYRAGFLRLKSFLWP